MKTLIAFLLLPAALVFAQAGVPIQVCWTPLNQTQTCYTVPPDQVAIVTIDGRQKPVQAVVVQPLPAYQLAAMQQHVDGQTYHMQQADGSLATKQRYTSIQDLLVQHMIRQIIVPALQLYPPTGADAGKATTDTVTTDLQALERVTPILPIQ